MAISRRKSFKPKEKKIYHPPKTSRTEMSEIERAFAVGAMCAIRGDFASMRELARVMGRSQATLSTLSKRTEEKSKELGVKPWDPVLYSNSGGRGRRVLLTQDQRDRIVAVVFSSQENREKVPRLAVEDGDFEHIVPQMSTSTFQKSMYAAGYVRRPFGKHKQGRCEWALAHSPKVSKRNEGHDNTGFDLPFPTVSENLIMHDGYEESHLQWAAQSTLDLPHLATRTELAE